MNAVIEEVWLDHKIVLDHKGFMHYDSPNVIKPTFHLRSVSIKPKYSCQKCQVVMEFEHEEIINPGHYPICEKCKLFAQRNNWGRRW